MKLFFISIITIVACLQLGCKDLEFPDAVDSLSVCTEGDCACLGQNNCACESGRCEFDCGSHCTIDCALGPDECTIQAKGALNLKCGGDVTCDDVSGGERSNILCGLGSKCDVEVGIISDVQCASACTLTVGNGSTIRPSVGVVPTVKCTGVNCMLTCRGECVVSCDSGTATQCPNDIWSCGTC